MPSAHLVYCRRCGGASDPAADFCRFCGANLPRPARGEDLADPSQLRWRTDEPPTQPAPAPVDPPSAGESPAAAGAERAPIGEDAPTQAWAGPVAAAAAYVDEEPTAMMPVDVLEDETGGWLPGWVWFAGVVVLGTLLGIGAYVVVDRSDDDAGIRTTDPTSTSSSSTAAPTTTAPPTSPPATDTLPPTTVLVLPPATAPASAPDSSPPTVPGAITVATEAPTTVATTVPETAPPTTPAPDPTTATTTSTTTTTTTTTTTAPPTPGTVPGDLGIAGVPMSKPPCDGQYITLIGAAKPETATAASVEQFMRSYPGSQYLLSDQTCPSLSRSSVYVVYFGPYASIGEACAARANGPGDSYVRQLTSDGTSKGSCEQ